MQKDIKDWTRSCISCQRAKVQRHTRAPVQAFPLPTTRFDRVHIDIVGPLPPSDGKHYLLTCVDRFTRWVEVVPLCDIRAETVARAFLSGWVSRFGVPSQVTTDRGSQFESGLWRRLSHMLGCGRLRTTSYHPQSNGLVERFHRQLKTSLRAADATARWTDLLPLILLGVRAALKEDLGCSAAELVYGQPLRLPGELVTSDAAVAHLDPASYVDQLRTLMRRLRPTAPRAPTSAQVFLPTDLQHCTHVFVRRDASRPPLTPPYDGPYRVCRRSDKTVSISRNGKVETVSIDRVKPAFVDMPAASVDASELPACTVPREANGPELFLPAPPLVPESRVDDPGPQLDSQGQCFDSDGQVDLDRSDAPCDPARAPHLSPPCPQPAALRPALRTRSGREVRLPVRFRHVTFLVAPDSAVSGEGATVAERSRSGRRAQPPRRRHRRASQPTRHCVGADGIA